MREYYGALNELKLRARSTVPQKPNCLEAYEMIQELKIPIVTGGLMDQPHLWLLEYSTVKQMATLMETLNNLAETSGQ